MPADWADAPATHVMLMTRYMHGKQKERVKQDRIQRANQMRQRSLGRSG